MKDDPPNCLFCHVSSAVFTSCSKILERAAMQPSQDSGHFWDTHFSWRETVEARSYLTGFTKRRRVLLSSRYNQVFVYYTQICLKLHKLSRSSISSIGIAILKLIQINLLSLVTCTNNIIPYNGHKY